MSKPVLKVEGLTKRFGSVLANDNISMELNEGEILSIVGENGAGKSTFCKMLTGLYQPTEGTIYINGEKQTFHSPTDSIKKGISMVYQERNLIGLMTGAQNVCFGQEPKVHGLISQKEITRIAEGIKERLGLTVPLDVPVNELGAGAQQLIEIMRAFNTDPKILILDEPTASLGEGEVEPFLNFIKSVREKTKLAIIFISHKLDEVFEISDKIAVFTDGVNVRTDKVENLTQEECIAAMLRADKVRKIEIADTDYQSRPMLLQVKCNPIYDGKRHNIDFDVRRGEIVGFYGLVGSGRTECAEALMGIKRSEDMSYTFNGETINRRTPLGMIEKGMILTPELRANAIFKTFSLTDNICNLFYGKELSSKTLGLVRTKEAAAFAERVLKKNNVKYADQSQPIISLSGGNMQKIVIGRSVEINNLKLLILDEPTTGIDIGAKYEIYAMLRELVKDGVSIIFISSELDELLAVTDRMYVFADGDVAAFLNRPEYDKKAIIKTAVGGGESCA